MAAVYSTQFICAHITTTGWHDLYTVPAAKLAILRDVDITNLFGAVQDLGIREGTGAVAFAFWSSYSALVPLEWRGRQVFVAGQTIGVYNGSGNMNAMASGYLLDV